MNSFVLTPCDLKPAINEDDLKAMRFHWIKDREILEAVVLQFTRLMFGLS